MNYKFHSLIIFISIFLYSQVVADDKCCSSNSSTTNCCSDSNKCCSDSKCTTKSSCLPDTCAQLTCFKKGDCNSKSSCNKKDDNLFGKTFFSFRPQDSNSVRRILSLVNTQNKVNDDLYDYCYKLDVTFEYQRSFKGDGLKKWFFFNGCDCMTVGIPGGDAVDVDGSQLGLSLGNTGTNLTAGIIGTICENPIVKNFITDIDFYFDLSKCGCGLWGRVNFPIVVSETNLNLCSTGSGQTSQEFPEGLFDINCLSTPVPFSSITDAFAGDSEFGAVPALNNGKFSQCKLRKTGVAGVHLDLGYDFLKSDCSYIGASLHAVIPTGNRPKGRFMFEPIIGANKSAQLGATLEAYTILNRSCNHQIGLYFYGIGTHLFKSRQTRVFALKNNGAGSQFLLLKQFNAIQDNIDGAQRVANVLTGETKIGADFMFDGSVMLQYNRCNWFFDVGYNFWVRTKEKISGNVCFQGFQEGRFGIKGNLPLSVEEIITCPEPTTLCTPDLRTASTSTIAKPGSADSDTTLLTCDDIDFSAPLQPLSWSNKVFGSIGYTRNICDRACYILIGGEAEFGKKNVAINQWGAIVQIGVEF